MAKGAVAPATATSTGAGDMASVGVPQAAHTTNAPPATWSAWAWGRIPICELSACHRSPGLGRLAARPCRTTIPDAPGGGVVGRHLPRTSYSGRGALPQGRRSLSAAFRSCRIQAVATRAFDRSCGSTTTLLPRLAPYGSKVAPVIVARSFVGLLHPNAALRRIRRWRHAMAAWLADRALASRYGIPFVAPSIPYWYRERPRYKALASPFQAWRGFARSRSRRRRAEQHCVQGRTRRLLRAVALLVRALRHDRRRAASLAFRFMVVRARARRFQKRVDRVFVRSWANHWRSTVHCFRQQEQQQVASYLEHTSSWFADAALSRYISGALMRSCEPGPSASISALGANFESVHQRNVCTRAPS